MLQSEPKLLRIGKKLKYVYQQEKLGLGQAVSLCKNFANNEPVLLVLGDQIYKTTNRKNCTEQIIDSFEKTGQLTVSVCEIEKKEVSKYGILSGTIKGNDNYFFVDKMVEKPEESIAEEKYYTTSKKQKKYYAVFGEYILTEDVFNILDKHIKNNQKENGEFQITSALDEARALNGMVAYITDGQMLDVGNIPSYRNAFIKKASKK
jgi:UTP-glucose-1-phosphate uridylyltransferase